MPDRSPKPDPFEALRSLGQDPPSIRVRPPGPECRTWLTRTILTAAPMGQKLPAEINKGVQADVPPGTIVYSTGSGSNVIDVDGNRYVDLVAGFGAMLLGHGHPSVLRVLELQARRLMQALGDLHPADAKIALLERLSELYPGGRGRVILGLSGSDAVSAALKTALLHTNKPGVLAFRGGYHGLSYGPLAACGLRESYRDPFAAQLNPSVRFLDYPDDAASAEKALADADTAFREAEIGAVLIEPILGRGGCIVLPPTFLPELGRLSRLNGALIIADEIWTGLGRSGKMLASVTDGFCPELICLGKGLGGGLPVSACLGSDQVMQAWNREEEVVHTSTFAGAPLSCATAIATLDVLVRERLVERAERVGRTWRSALSDAVKGFPTPIAVRGTGLMLGIDVGTLPGGAMRVQRALLERGYLVSTGGGQREVLILTPALSIAEPLLDGFVAALYATLQALLT